MLAVEPARRDLHQALVLLRGVYGTTNVEPDRPARDATQGLLGLRGGAVHPPEQRKVTGPDALARAAANYPGRIVTIRDLIDLLSAEGWVSMAADQAETVRVILKRAMDSANAPIVRVAHGRYQFADPPQAAEQEAS